MQIFKCMTCGAKPLTSSPAFARNEESYTELHSKPDLNRKSRLGFLTQQQKENYALNATRYNKRFAQNLIEFIFVLPVLIFLTLVIFEVALFWQDVNAIYNLNAEINANVALKKDSGLKLNDTCISAKAALDILEKRDTMISLTNPTYNTKIVDGTEPFALYQYWTNNITVGGVAKPQISLWVDCRNPFEDGVSTQIEFYHKTLIMKASIPRFDKGEPIEIIPEHIFIASPKLNTIRHY